FNGRYYTWLKKTSNRWRTRPPIKTLERKRTRPLNKILERNPMESNKREESHSPKKMSTELRRGTRKKPKKNFGTNWALKALKPRKKGFKNSGNGKRHRKPKPKNRPND